MPYTTCHKCNEEFYYDIDLGINVESKTLVGKVLGSFRNTWPYCGKCEVICWPNKEKADIKLLLKDGESIQQGEIICQKKK